ncbi:Carbohydrate sulfotransferase 4 [Folsomia candida]|uniref:Carbohydrate sulfotransferase 4 n=1 Tax=Folsomia candida TaxID=158441 RepID=A0A226D748_FOLCA|nr:Carbohydrate sulfotransferase 4 [Folsomia candida]
MKILHKLVVVTTALFGVPSLLYFKNDKSNQSRNERYVWQRDSKVLPPLYIRQTYDMPEENLHIQNLPNQSRMVVVTLNLFRKSAHSFPSNSSNLYDTRLIYLVRDPRGTMKSRNNGSNYWCDHHPDCSDERRLCSDLVDEFADAKTLREKYPKRFKVLRYEDVSLNVPLAAKTILPFFRLSYHSKVKQFAMLHSRLTRKGEFGTYRNSKKVAFSWFNFYRNNVTRLDRIQNSCEEAMDLWGYKPLDINRLEVDDDGYQGNYTLKGLVLDQPPWEDMNFL